MDRDVRLATYLTTHPSDGETDLPFEDGGEVVTETHTERQLKKPRKYKVLLHNDDFTTMEFVVYVLRTIFQHSETKAMHIMLHVHHNGVGVAGVYPYQIAETRVNQVESLARQQEFPLRCSLEED